jgi:hypothetical protein
MVEGPTEISAAEYEASKLYYKHDLVPDQGVPDHAPDTTDPQMVHLKTLTGAEREDLVQSLTPGSVFSREDTMFTLVITPPDLSDTDLELVDFRYVYNEVTYVDTTESLNNPDLENGVYTINKFATFDNPTHTSNVTCQWDYADSTGGRLIMQQHLTTQGNEADGLTGFGEGENTEITEAAYNSGKLSHEHNLVPVQDVPAPAPHDPEMDTVHLDKPFNILTEAERADLAKSLTPELSGFDNTKDYFKMELNLIHIDTDLEQVEF